MCQLDLAMAFPQAPVERELHMEIPKGMNIEDPENFLVAHRKITCYK
jgi:hypothetical protein